MNWRQTRERLDAMVDIKLLSITGRADIRLRHVGQDSLTLSAASHDRTRPINELRRIVRKMDLLMPIHVDSVLFGSGTSRNQPETILANMPDVEYLYIDNRKHIVWMGHQTHELGTLKEIDPFNASEIRLHYGGRGPITGRGSTSIVVLAKDVKQANSFLSELLQGPEPRPLVQGGRAYSVSTESVEALLIIEPESDIETFQIVPVVNVVEIAETLRRIKAMFHSVEIREFDVGRKLTVIYLPNGNMIALD